MPDKTEAQWQAESDANTLAEGAAIHSDKKRIGAAKRAASRMAKEQQVKATALKSISKKPAARKSSPKRGGSATGLSLR